MASTSYPLIPDAKGFQCILLAIIVYFLFRKWWKSAKLHLPPGPTCWPLIGTVDMLLQPPRSTDEDYYFTKCAKKYGDIYRLQLGSQSIYVLGNVEYMRQAFTNPRIQDRDAAVAAMKVFGKNAHGIAFSSQHPWTVSRKFTVNLFRELGVGRKDFHNTITTEIRRLEENLDTLVGRPIDDIFDRLCMSVSNVMNGVMLGKQFAYSDETFRRSLLNSNKLLEEAGPGFLGFTSSFLCALPFGPGHNVIGRLRAVLKFLMPIIKERQQKRDAGVKATNFVDAYLTEMESGDSDPTFHMDNLVHCCSDMYMAGADTTTSTLAFAINFLITHPRVQAKCQRELDGVLGTDGAPDYSDRDKFPYLLATIQETDRMSLIAPTGVPHKAECDLKLFGYDCPKGTLIMVNMGSIFMNEAIFENPREFKPERFIKDGCFQKSEHILPFSIGKRVCPGEQLSRMELFLYMSHMLRRYSFRLPDGAAPLNFLEGRYGATRKPMPFTFTLVKRANSSVSA